MTVKTTNNVEENHVFLMRDFRNDFSNNELLGHMDINITLDINIVKIGFDQLYLMIASNHNHVEIYYNL